MIDAYAKSVAAQTASGLIATGKAALVAVLLTGDGTNIPTLDIYDNTAASGTKIFSATLPISTRSQLFPLVLPARCDIGMYASISGTGAIYSVYYV